MKLARLIICLLLTAITWPILTVLALAFCVLILAFHMMTFSDPSTVNFEALFATPAAVYRWWRDKLTAGCVAVRDFFRGELS